MRCLISVLAVDMLRLTARLSPICWNKLHLQVRELTEDIECQVLQSTNNHRLLVRLSCLSTLGVNEFEVSHCAIAAGKVIVQALIVEIIIPTAAILSYFENEAERFVEQVLVLKQCVALFMSA